MSRAHSRTEAVRRFNRFYTRRIGALQPGYLGSAFPLPQARVLYELGRRGLDEGSRRATGEMLAPLPAAHREKLVQALQTVHSLLEPQAAKGLITLRAHRPGDIGWVIQRHGAIYDEQYGWGVRFEALVAGIAAKFIQHFDAKRERCWIAEMHGAPVGCVFVVKQSPSVAKLRLLIVEPQARGHGLGKRLVQECIAFARRAGYKKLVLWTQSNLLAARAVYAAQGFRKMKSEPHREFGVPLVGEYWELALG